MRAKFQADNDLDQRIVVAAKRLAPTLDFQTAQALGLHRIPDLEVLSLAAGQGRILVSHDRRTMPRYFRQFITQENSPGLIVVSQRLSVSKAAELLHLLWFASDAAEYANIIYSLP